METWLLLHVPTALLVVGITVLCIALSIGGLWLVRRNVELSQLEAHHDVAGFILAVIGVVYAVLLAFVVIIVWQDFDTARADTDHESAVLIGLYRDAAVLADSGADARPALRVYAQSIVDDEWPQMSEEHQESRTTDEALSGVWAAFSKIQPRTDSATAFYEEAVSSLHDASELRRDRIATSGRALPSSLWGVLIVGALISIGFTYFFGVRSFAAQGLMVGALAALVGLVLALILSLDLPFTGRMAVGPSAMQNAATEFQHTAP